MGRDGPLLVPHLKLCPFGFSLFQLCACPYRAHPLIKTTLHLFTISSSAKSLSLSLSLSLLSTTNISQLKLYIFMVSFHTPRTKMMNPDFENSSKKRKWDESQAAEAIPPNKTSKNNTTNSMFDTKLHHETPLPLEWQRCLDIQSGQIYFYNTRTRMRTSKDPRITPSPPSPPPGHMSLDLELNLPCGSASESHGSAVNSSMDKNKMGGLTRSPSWLNFDQGDNQEMVTAVCKKCHMLVMMLKASPSCPNCKFMHPPDQSPRSLNPSLSLLC